MSSDSEELSSNLKLIVRSSFIVFFGVLLSKVFSYLYRIIMARNYGPEEYGLFSLAIMLVGWFTAFGAIGLTEGVIRYGAFYKAKKQPQKVSYTRQITVKITLISSLVLGAILFLLSSFIANQIFHNNGLVIYLKFFSILVPVGVLGGAYLSLILAYERVGWYSFIFNILQNFVKLGVLAGLIFLGFKTNAIILSYLAGSLAILVSSYIVTKKAMKEIFSPVKLKSSEKGKLRRDLISYSWPLFLYGIVFNLFFWIDTFVIGLYVDATNVGYYNAAVPIALLVGFFPGFFLQIFFPLITREYSKGRKEVIEQLSKQMTKWTFISTTPIFILIFFFPGVFINILFGAEYLAAETSLRILSIGALFLSLSTVTQNLTSMTGRSKVILINFILASVINLVLNIILVPKYGIDGAALSTTLVYGLLYLTFLIETRIFLGIIPLRRKMIQVLLAALVSAAMLLYVKQKFDPTLLTFILSGIAFILLYGILIICTGALDRNDILIIKQIKEKFFRS